jgi:hypothetical protein
LPECDALGHLHADEERAHQSRPLRHRHRVELREGHPGVGHRLLDHGADVLEVMARGHLRHHAAVEGVQCGLGRHDVREDAASVFDHRRRRLVARGLDGEDAQAQPSASARRLET